MRRGGERTADEMAQAIGAGGGRHGHVSGYRYAEKVSEAEGAL